MYHVIEPEIRIMHLDEYVEFVNENVNTDDIASIEETSWALGALANDRHFVLDEFHNELKANMEGGSRNQFSPQSVLLHIQREFYIRANIWPTIDTRPQRDDGEKALFSYELPHNHNFHFASVGYFGPGYRTNLFRCDYDSIIGYQDEPVELTPLGIKQLSPGSVMVYEGNYDVHEQFAPEMLSVSVNLMCRNAAINETSQYVFDTGRSSISGGPGDLVGNRLFMISISNVWGTRIPWAYWWIW
jgi:hypothetical protein